MKRAHLRLFRDDSKFVISIQSSEENAMVHRWRYKRNLSLVSAILANHSPEYDVYDFNGDGDFRPWAETIKKAKAEPVPPFFKLVI